MSQWSDAESHAERAREFYQSGQWDKALFELQAALDVNPDQSDWHFGMGLTLDAMHRYREAITSFEAALRLRGHDLETMLHLAVDLIRNQEPQRAVTLLEQVNAIDPACESGYCYRIAAYAQMGDHDQAEVMFYLARQVEEACPHCYEHLAHSLATRGELERAIWCWQQVVQLDPQFPQVHANLARGHWKRGQMERAKDYYLQELRQSPGDIGVLMELGDLLVEMDQPAEATEKFRRALELAPPGVPGAAAAAHLRLGELALAAGHLDAAEVELERAQRQAADLPGLRLRLAQVAQQRGRLAKALELLSGDIEAGHLGPSQSLEAARMLIELHKPRLARQLLAAQLQAAAALPQHEEYRATLLRYRGVAWILERRLDRGIADCRAALRLAPRDTMAMYNLVLAYAELGRFGRAWFWLRQALEVSPQDASFRQLRFRLRLAQLRSWLRQGRRMLLGR